MGAWSPPAMQPAGTSTVYFIISRYCVSAAWLWPITLALASLGLRDGC